ncbi:hypothetical protein OSG_eHP27_00025 [environmental Halophage eHP-27]|nr:hypothetical protein OSG_eHP27_00025 [environmental Halophage eHP-27]
MTVSIAGIGVVAVRAIQFILGALAVVFIVGGLLANVNVIAFAALGILALVLLAFVGVLELAVWGVRRRRAGGSA